MLGFLEGKVREVEDGTVLLTIGGAEGLVGYSVNVPQSPAYLSIRPGERMELFIYTHVREDQFSLYGFQSKEEKDLFLTLTSISGLGNKAGLAILSVMDPDALVQTILSGDKAALTKVPGIGKKSAERVILELSDKLKKQYNETFLLETAKGKSKLVETQSTRYQDAKAALMELGFRENDVKNHLDQASPDAGVEELVRSALKGLR